MPPHFPKMVMAELRAVFGRNSGKGAVILAFVVGILAAVALNYAQQQAANVQANGMPVANMIDTSWRGVCSFALGARNLFILPMLLVLATASTLSGEVGEHTLREILVRPVSRWSIVLAKFLALTTLSAATLIATLLPALLGGATLFGTEAEIGPVLLGYLASWSSDLGLIAMAMLIASFMRNVGGVVVVVVLYLMVDKAFGLLLKLLGTLGVEKAATIQPFVPGNALACWEGWENGWESGQFIGLAVLFVVCMAGTLLRVQRMDVP